MNESDLYFYKAYVTKVYDGDTVTVDFDLGLGVMMMKQTIRLYGINTPELRGSDEEKAKGRAARDFLRSYILGEHVLIKTYKKKSGDDKKGKYGRWLGVIYFEGADMNAKLVMNGHAVTYMV